MARDARQGQPGNWQRRAQAGLLLPIAVVIGLIAFTSVAASAASPTLRSTASTARASGVGAVDLRFDLASNAASTQYCKHDQDQQPPCGNGKGNGFGFGNGNGNGNNNGGLGAGAGGTGAPATSPTAASTSGTTTSASGNSLPFTGEDVLLVILVGLLMTEAGLGLAARARLRTS
jgi:hypothetical protein